MPIIRKKGYHLNYLFTHKITSDSGGHIYPFKSYRIRN